MRCVPSEQWIWVDHGVSCEGISAALSRGQILGFPVRRAKEYQCVGREVILAFDDFEARMRITDVRHGTIMTDRGVPLWFIDDHYWRFV